MELITLTPPIRAERGHRQPARRADLSRERPGRGRLGIQSGDVIVQINRTPIQSADEAARAIDAYAGRGLIRMYYERGGRVVLHRLHHPMSGHGRYVVAARRAVRVGGDARAVVGADALRTVAPALARARREGARAGRLDSGRGDRADARAPRRHRLRRGGGLRAPVPTRRHGARPRVRRRRARGAAVHPPRRHERVRHRQRRSDHSCAAASSCCARRSSTCCARSRRSRASGATSRRSATRTCSPRSSPRSASARRSGCRTSSSISRTSTIASRRCPFRGVKGTTGTQATFLELFDGDHAQRAPARASSSRRRDGLRARRFPSPARRTRGSSTRRCWASSRASPRARRSSAATCACCRRSARSRSRSRPSRSDRPRWRTSATRCAPSGSRRSRGSSCRWRRTRTRRTACSTSSARSTTAPTGVWCIPESFLATDAILVLMANIAAGSRCIPPRVRQRVDDELPFMATEELLVRAVRAGGDRQAAHEIIRRHSIAAAQRAQGRRATATTCSTAWRADRSVRRLGRLSLRDAIDPREFVGRAPEQVDEFLARGDRSASRRRAGRRHRQRS